MIMTICDDEERKGFWQDPGIWVTSVQQLRTPNRRHFANPKFASLQPYAIQVLI